MNKCCSVSLYDKPGDFCDPPENNQIHKFQDLTEDEQYLIVSRGELESLPLETICDRHLEKYLTKFEFYHASYCCNPYKQHKLRATNRLKLVSLEESKLPAFRFFKIKPGSQVCKNCYLSIDTEYEKQKANVPEFLKFSQSSEEDHQSASSNSSQQFSQVSVGEIAGEKMNMILPILGCSPIKKHGLTEDKKTKYGSGKLEKVGSIIHHDMEKALGVKLPVFCNKETLQKAEAFDEVFSAIKSQLRTSNSREQLQLLTLAPFSSWSQPRIAKEFEVSEHAVKRAMALKRDSGVLALPPPKIGKKLKEDTKLHVQQFYESDEISRMMPGMKDKISIGNKQHKQKRLILANLKEIYSDFKINYPNENIGFSKFCSLRPRWCVLAGEPGTHSVCVCALHQNVTLMVQAMPVEESYKDFMSRFVCDTKNRDCMLRRCEKCPDIDEVRTYLESALIDYTDAEVPFSEWETKNSKSFLRSTTLPVDEFIDLFLERMEKLLPHSYTAKSQAQFVKDLKENLKEDEAVLITDFSENFGFIVQDAIQGFHWNKDSCTIFPVMMYHRVEGKVKATPICIISDDLKHDVAMVYYMQSVLTDFMKEKYPLIKKLHYVSDGCGGQFKNKYNFLNLLHHFEDFQLEADWVFFATSHGKTECDGIGGTTKRLVRKESLQRPYSKQLLTSYDVYSFCHENIKNVTFFYASKSEVDAKRTSLEKRMLIAKTVPGTRSFHHFEKVSLTKLITKRVSKDPSPAMIFDFEKNADILSEKIKALRPNTFVACEYENEWYFALVETIFYEEQDVMLKFLHPKGPTSYFYWPRIDDRCSVPVTSIICAVETPQLTSSGKTFKFSQETIDNVIKVKGIMYCNKI